jgi:hypothetical protein
MTVMGDFDGDGLLDVATASNVLGRADLVALTMRGETLVYLGDGHGGFVRNTESIPAHETCRGAHVELADLDGDGRDEIVASFADEDQGCPSGGAITAWKLRPAK